MPLRPASYIGQGASLAMARSGANTGDVKYWDSSYGKVSKAAKDLPGVLVVRA